MTLDLFSVISIACGCVACVVSVIQTRCFRTTRNVGQILSLLFVKFFVASMAPSGLLFMVAPFYPALMSHIPNAPLFQFFAGLVVSVISVLAIFKKI